VALIGVKEKIMLSFFVTLLFFVSVVHGFTCSVNNVPSVVAPIGVTPPSNPLAVPTDYDTYLNNIRAVSNNSCPVQPVDPTTYFNEHITKLHYFIVDTNGNHHLESWGYQYFSFSHQTYRWDQVLSLDPSYSPSTSEYYESGQNQNGILSDITIDMMGNVHCVQVPVPLASGNSAFNGTEYVGIQTFPPGTFQTPGLTFDVYSSRGTWIGGNNVVFFVDRSNGLLSHQLYFQGVPNYFWDFSGWIHNGTAAQALLAANSTYYLSMCPLWKLCPTGSPIISSCPTPTAAPTTAPTTTPTTAPSCSGAYLTAPTLFFSLFSSFFFFSSIFLQLYFE